MDFLRGVALLGIALMNIIFSAPPLAAGWNPNVAGGSTGVNLWVFFIEIVLFNGKMRGLFSIMFGAGAYLFIHRLESKGAGLKAAEIYYHRLLWLMVFGLVHAYLIWDGDILYPYSLAGLVLPPLMNLSPRKLLVVAAAGVAIMTGQYIQEGFHALDLKKVYLETQTAERAGKTLTEKQKEAKSAWESLQKRRNPSAEDLKKEREMYSGSYFHLVAKRSERVLSWHSAPFYLDGWDWLVMMLVGIALLKLGILGAQRTTGFYVKTMLICYLISIPISLYAAVSAWGSGFDIVQSAFVFSTYQITRAVMTVGHLCLLILFYRSDWLPWLQSLLSAIGKTAFSNYIAHSLIYGFVFYGYGFDLFGKLQRHQIYYVVAGMWASSLIVSPLWLKAYRYGPLEWCWRSLTYWKRQPMRLYPATERAPATSMAEPGR